FNAHNLAVEVRDVGEMSIRHGDGRDADDSVLVTIAKSVKAGERCVPSVVGLFRLDDSCGFDTNSLDAALDSLPFFLGVGDRKLTLLGGARLDFLMVCDIERVYHMVKGRSEVVKNISDTRGTSVRRVRFVEEKMNRDLSLIVVELRNNAGSVCTFHCFDVAHEVDQVLVSPLKLDTHA